MSEAEGYQVATAEAQHLGRLVVGGLEELHRLESEAESALAEAGVSAASAIVEGRELKNTKGCQAVMAARTAVDVQRSLLSELAKRHGAAVCAELSLRPSALEFDADQFRGACQNLEPTLEEARARLAEVQAKAEEYETRIADALREADLARFEDRVSLCFFAGSPDEFELLLTDPATTIDRAAGQSILTDWRTRKTKATEQAEHIERVCIHGGVSWLRATGQIAKSETLSLQGVRKMDGVSSGTSDSQRWKAYVLGELKAHGIAATPTSTSRSWLDWSPALIQIEQEVLA
ncbi:MAG: hypothetical protein NTW86_15260 [Candidatus Sumerlaeota bacterium]|nr:hypothetical protein [Candidatus Sumerlaeota bacterium]